MMALKRSPTPWSDLHPELLGLVLRRLPSLADRVRLRAVCHDWRRFARLMEPGLPPPLPWLTLHDSTFVSFPAGEIHRMPLVPQDGDDDAQHYCHGSVGNNWLFFQNKVDGMCSLINPLNSKGGGGVVRLPPLAPFHLVRSWIMESFFKLVLPSSSGHLSPDSLFAILVSLHTKDDDSMISIGQTATATASPFRALHELMCDAAFFDGKLYAISSSNKLFLLEIDSGNQGNNPRIQSMKCVVDAVDDSTAASQSFPKGYKYMCWRYLVESGGRLLQIRRTFGAPSSLSPYDRVKQFRTVSFDLFEADLSNSCGQWRPVNTLGGQALFVAGTHSKFLPASECGAHEDCIYFMCDYDPGFFDQDPFRDCGLFHMRNGIITPMLPKIAVMQTQPKTICKGRQAWFFPTEAM